MARRLLIVLVPIVLLTACGETALLVPELEPEEEFTISTTADGEIYQVDDGISLEVQASGGDSVNGDDPVLERLEITLAGIDGEVIGTSTIEGEELQEGVLPDIGVPDVEPGEYKLTLALYVDGEEVSRTERRFFIAQGSYAIDGVTAYPPSFFPASSGIMRVQLSAPEQADPYLRWTMDGEIIAEGYQSEGLEEVLVKSSSSEGVYPLLVEVFPTGPTQEGTFPFESSARYSTQIVVRRTADLGDNDLAPEASYYSLFHFMGNLRDDGARIEMFDLPRAAEPVGTPDLRVTNGVFGYHLDGTSGVEVSDFLLPVRDGALSPFSVSARLIAADPEEASGDDADGPTFDGPRNLFRAETADGEVSFQVATNADGTVAVELGIDGQRDTVVSGQPLISSSEPREIVVSLLPGSRETTVVWFVDGDFVWADSLSVAAVPESAGGAEDSTGSGTDGGTTADAVSGDGDGGANGTDGGDSSNTAPTDLPGTGGTSEPEWEDRAGTSVIGGENGFVGVIDELGIYFRDEDRNPTSDLTVFRKAQERLYGNDLVYAAGFERPDVREELESEGEIRIAAGDLVIEPGASVIFPEFLFRGQDLILEIEAQDPAASPETAFDFRNLADPPEALFTFFPDGVVAVSQPEAPAELERTELPVVGEGQVALRLRHDGDTLVIADTAGEESVEVGVEDFDGLQLQVTHPTGSDVAFRIRSVLAFTENSSLSRALGQDGAEPERQDQQ